jgi:hypothetical protein
LVAWPLHFLKSCQTKIGHLEISSAFSMFDPGLMRDGITFSVCEGGSQPLTDFAAPEPNRI